MRLITNVDGLRNEEGKVLAKGEEFEAAEKNGIILKKLGKASDAPVKKTDRADTPPAQSSLSLSDKQMKPEDMVENGRPTPRRRYQRRDMAAED